MGMRREAVVMAAVVLAVVMMAPAVVSAEDRGTLGKDDFVSSSIDAVFDKVNKITSGESKIIDRKFMESEERQGRTEDALDRKLSESVVIRTGKSTAGAQAPAAQAVQAEPAKQ